MSTRLLAFALASLLAAGLAGCGLGAGARSTDARVLVTRDFGGHELGGKLLQQLPSSDTVMRLLQREFEVKTRFGGGFVQSIDGLAGGREHGDPVDWFFYVNGIESDKGATDVQLHGGDRVWWDRHDWKASAHVPAVVGSYPEPFLHGSNGRRYPVVLECVGPVEASCTTVSERLTADGVRVARQAPGTGTGIETMRVLVGTWAQLQGDPALEQLARGPSVSGVYARFEDGGSALALLDPHGDAARTLHAGAGLVLATRFEEQAPTWAITGTDVDGVAAAAHALGEQRLRAHFALAIEGGDDVAVPVVR